jgi:hypothetical protein
VAFGACCRHRVTDAVFGSQGGIKRSKGRRRGLDLVSKAKTAALCGTQLQLIAALQEVLGGHP